MAYAGRAFVVANCFVRFCFRSLLPRLFRTLSNGETLFLSFFNEYIDKAFPPSAKILFFLEIASLRSFLPCFIFKDTVTASVTGESAPFNCSFSWNEDNFILDNFDAYAPFTLEPATKDKNWIYWDLDKRKTVSFEGVQFPHAEEETSFMVFNPYHTDPKVAFFDEKSLSLSGNQYLAAFSCQQGTAANYLFSPLLAYDGDLHFGFFAKSFTDAYGKEIIRVGYTPEAYPKDHNAIIWLSEPIELQEKSWRKYDFSLPPEAKRAVVAHLSKEAFYIMLDNVYVGEPSPFADGIVNKPAKDSIRLYLSDNQQGRKECRVKGLRIGNEQVSFPIFILQCFKELSILYRQRYKIYSRLIC